MTEERKIERGSVFYIRYDRTIGFEEAAGRPALVVSSEEGIRTSPVVQIVFLTTSPRENGTCVAVNSLARASWAICNQLNTVDKSRLDKKMGTLTYSEMKLVDEKLIEVLGLNNGIARIEGERAEEVQVDANEIAELKVELALHKALYEKTLEKLIELRLEKDNVTVAAAPTVVEKPIVVEEKKPTLEEISEPIDLSALQEKFRVHDERLAEKKEEPVEGVAPQVETYSGPVGRAQRIDIGRKLNINTATITDFMSIGMGVSISKKIVGYRNRHGKYRSVEELLNVSGFGRGCYEVYTPGLTV